VSNITGGTNTVTYTYNSIGQMDTRQISYENYRFGYQGQFAEKDSLTNWNAFQLRMYDARFGRWISPDPYGQFASPYVGMGNQPVSGVDSDGGLFGLPTPWSQIVGASVGFGLRAGLAVATGHKDDWWSWGLGGAIGGFLIGEYTAGDTFDYHGSSTARPKSGGKWHTNERTTKWNNDRLRQTTSSAPQKRVIEPDTWREPGRRRDQYAKLIGKASLDKTFQWTMWAGRASGSIYFRVNNRDSQEMDERGGQVKLHKGASQVDFEIDPDRSSSNLIEQSRSLGLEVNPPTGYGHVWFEGTGPTLQITHYRSGLLGLRVHTRITKIIQ
jgi:RHS repeat-associated protein